MKDAGSISFIASRACIDKVWPPSTQNPVPAVMAGPMSPLPNTHEYAGIALGTVEGWCSNVTNSCTIQ